MKKEPKDPERWIEWFVEMANLLRRNAEKARRMFIQHLQLGETREEMWRLKAVTYDQFLRSYDIISPERYRKEVRSIQIVGAQETDVIGITATVLVAKVVDTDARTAAIHELVEKATARGVPFTSQNAKNVIYKYAPPAPKSDTAAYVRELERTVKELRQQIEGKDAIIVGLRARLGIVEMDAGE